VHDDNTPGEASDHESSEASSAKTTGGVDVMQLADRVYQLMIRELRLDLARSGRVMNRREA
jgi:hypothetical protein